MHTLCFQHLYLRRPFDLTSLLLFCSQRCRSCPVWCCPVKWSSPKARSLEKVWGSSQRLGSKQEPRWALSLEESCPLNTWTCSRITTSCGRWVPLNKILWLWYDMWSPCGTCDPETSWVTVWRCFCALRCSMKTARCATSSMPARRTSAAGWLT